jgi:hypothetical protein
MKTIAQRLNVKEFPFVIKNKNGRVIYKEFADGLNTSIKYFANNPVRINSSNGYWAIKEYDIDNNVIYYEDSMGKLYNPLFKIIDKSNVQKPIQEMENKTIAQMLELDAKEFPLVINDKNDYVIYYENSSGEWYRKEYFKCIETYYESCDGYWHENKLDYRGNTILHKNSNMYWIRKEYDENNEQIYSIDSTGNVIDNRPRKKSLNGTMVEIDGIRYRLLEELED